VLVSNGTTITYRVGVLARSHEEAEKEALLSLKMSYEQVQSMVTEPI
jgi:hypothetical protein